MMETVMLIVMLLIGITAYSIFIVNLTILVYVRRLIEQERRDAIDDLEKMMDL